MTDRFNEQEHFAARIAWLYYQEGLTQEAIADQLRTTRARVNRIVNEARSSGLVSVRLNYTFGSCLAAERQLVEAYGLNDARVIPTPNDEEALIRLLGQAAGRYLDDVLIEGKSLAIGWGRTVDAALKMIQPRKGRGHVVASLFGGLPIGGALNPYEVTTRFAHVLGATSYYVTAPMFASSAEARDLMRREPAVRDVLARAAQADVALISASDLSRRSKNMIFGVIDETLRRSLIDAGAVGDSCGIYLDASGCPVHHPVTQRMIVPELEDLLAIPCTILASGGYDKVGILRACLRAGLGKILVTDEESAQELLARS